MTLREREARRSIMTSFNKIDGRDRFNTPPGKKRGLEKKGHSISERGRKRKEGALSAHVRRRALAHGKGKEEGESKPKSSQLQEGICDRVHTGYSRAKGELVGKWDTEQKVARGERPKPDAGRK